MSYSKCAMPSLSCLLSFYTIPISLFFNSKFFYFLVISMVRPKPDRPDRLLWPCISASPSRSHLHCYSSLVSDRRDLTFEPSPTEVCFVLRCERVGVRSRADHCMTLTLSLTSSLPFKHMHVHSLSLSLSLSRLFRMGAMVRLWKSTKPVCQQTSADPKMTSMSFLSLIHTSF